MVTFKHIWQTFAGVGVVSLKTVGKLFCQVLGLLLNIVKLLLTLMCFLLAVITIPIGLTLWIPPRTSTYSDEWFVYSIVTPLISSVLTFLTSWSIFAVFTTSNAKAAAMIATVYLVWTLAKHILRIGFTADEWVWVSGWNKFKEFLLK
jgi:hypothetical protein